MLTDVGQHINPQVDMHAYSILTFSSNSPAGQLSSSSSTSSSSLAGFTGSPAELNWARLNLLFFALPISLFMKQVEQLSRAWMGVELVVCCCSVCQPSTRTEDAMWKFPAVNRLLDGK